MKVSANGLQIHYEEAGGGPPLILLHGGTGTGQEWTPLIPTFAAHFRVLAPDSRGHGRTDNPAGALGYGAMAEDVVAFAEVTGAHRPLLFGFSDGAQVALELAMHSPGFAQAIVAAGALYHYSETYFAQLRVIGLRGPGQVDFNQFQRVAPDWARLLQTTHVRPDDPDYWKRVLDWISGLWYTPLQYTAAALDRITTPVLVVQGDRDEYIPVEEALALYRMIPGSELAVIPNGLHDAPLYTPGARALALDFLLRHVGRSKD